MTPEELAKEIAADLFTNGARERAARLVLELEDGRDGGGWCEQAAADRIAKKLRSLLAERERLRGALTLARPPIYAQAKYGDVADRDSWEHLIATIDAALAGAGEGKG